MRYFTAVETRRTPLFRAVVGDTWERHPDLTPARDTRGRLCLTVTIASTFAGHQRGHPFGRWHCEILMASPIDAADAATE